MKPAAVYSAEGDASQLRMQASQIEENILKTISPGECASAAKSISSRGGKIAVFLGAGASKTFGWPLTNELLPLMLDGLIDGDLFEDRRINTRADNKKDRALLTRTLKALCPGIDLNKQFLEKSRLDLPLVTSMLSMLDFSLSTGQALVSGFTPDITKQARTLFERAIYEIVEHEIAETSPDNWPMRSANTLTHSTVKWLDDLRNDSAKVGVITSNYDRAIEQAWGFNVNSYSQITDQQVDLGFSWLWASNFSQKIVPRPSNPKRRLYKLHGSTNWLRCGLCDRVHINPGFDIAIFAFQRSVDDNNRCHCGHANLEPQIVSPSFIRDGRMGNLQSVWQASLDWLREAEDWIIIGYSFPDEDLNIRSLFARALASRKQPPFITAIQRGINPQTQMRYQAFFPKETLRYIRGGLGAFLSTFKS